MKKLIVAFSLTMLFASFSFGEPPLFAGILSSAGTVSEKPEVVYTPEDRQIFHCYIVYIRPWQSAHTDSLLERTAVFFLDSPYVSHTLEVPGEEKLVVNLREFDCTTFVESVIALTRTARSGKPDFDTFLHELQRIRYRDGNLQDYASRLHYTSDWLYDNEKKGLLKNSSPGLGGIPEKKIINFMTTHRDAYRQLKSDDVLLQEIRIIENGINERDGFYYLPKENIAVTAPMIPHMSMIAFTTIIKGLDVSHMGFAFQEENRLTFIHASSTQKKVVVDQKTLSDYCAGQSSCTGIIVAEVL